MCSIYGAIGRSIKSRVIESIRGKAMDRGRDGGQMVRYQLGSGNVALLGNWRAAPVTEVETGPLQPYSGLVHNGTVANDKELGALAGEIDSQVLARVLDRSNVQAFASSLDRVQGSYAVACVARNTILAAVNYKPLYYWADDNGTVYFSSMARHFEDVMPFGQAPVQLPPYSAIDFLSGESVTLPRTFVKRALVICSGGLDSVTVAAKLKADGYEICLLHFRYGCLAESRESAMIPLIANRLGADYKFLTLSSYPRGCSTLLSGEIPDGMESTEFAYNWVPARNLLMMATAIAYAEATGYHAVALGNNLEEGGSYPDNEEQMTTLLDAVMPYAVQNGYEIRILSPVGQLMKHEIVKLGLSVNAPFDLTWSCYRDGAYHCGQCGPCFMRKAAFERIGAVDPAFESDALELAA